MKHIYFFIGTTAEFIKLAPIIKELKRRRVRFKIITSGQNVIKFHELDHYVKKVTAHYRFRQRPLGIHVPLMLGFVIWTVKAMVNYILYFRHELYGRTKNNTHFIVHGDTVSSLLGAFIAKLFGVKLIHVESGLRSYNFLEPFPEELCRYIVSKLADVHFCPNAWSLQNLSSVHGTKINTRQNTLIESFWSAMNVRKKSHFAQALKSKRLKYFVLVAHRQEHVLFGKSGTGTILEYILHNTPPRLKCVLVLHDLSSSFINEFRTRTGETFTEKIIPMKLLPYCEFLQVLKGAEFIVTDGGSNQEEMYYMGKPCLLIRNNTERIEGLKRNVVLSKFNHGIIRHFLHNYVQYEVAPVRITQRPASIIVNQLRT